ncbi:MAG: hypothetical protein ACWA5W_02010 [Phycisphaerales bacterium]
MNDSSNNRSDSIHLSDDSEHVRMETLLDQLAEQDAEAMPSGLNERALDAIGQAMVPSPISISSEPDHSAGSPGTRLSMRLAAAAVLATGTTLIIVGAKPWATTPGALGGQIELASLEHDLDAFFALESVDIGNLDEAFTDWEIRAQSVDLDAELDDYQWGDLESEDGAL